MSLAARTAGPQGCTTAHGGGWLGQESCLRESARSRAALAPALPPPSGCVQRQQRQCSIAQTMLECRTATHEPRPTVSHHAIFSTLNLYLDLNLNLNVKVRWEIFRTTRPEIRPGGALRSKKRPRALPRDRSAAPAECGNVKSDLVHRQKRPTSCWRTILQTSLRACAQTYVSVSSMSV
jgi:hypothetical protein